MGFRDEYLTWNTLKRWCLDIVKKVKGLTTSVEKSDAPAGESPAVEVLKFRDNKGFFSSWYLLDTVFCLGLCQCKHTISVNAPCYAQNVKCRLLELSLHLWCFDPIMATGMLHSKK